MGVIGIILDSAPYWGGSFQYALNILEAVYAFSQKNDMTVCAFYVQSDWGKILSEYIIKIIRITGGYTRDILIIDGQKCDFVVGTSQAGWSVRLKTPVIEPIHDLMHKYEPGFAEVSEDLEEEKRDIIFASIARNALAVLVDSEVGATHVKEIYGSYHAGKIFKLPFSAPKYLSEEIEEFQLPFDKYFFYPAQFWAHKNHKSLIIAVDKLRTQGISVNFIFVGSAKNAYEEVKELIKNKQLEKQICIMDYVSNGKMRYLYENARALVMPTFFGPTNIPPLEAILLGCPVAVSGIYAMPEQLGDAAMYFDPHIIDDICVVLKGLWVDDILCERLKINGKKIAEQFSQDAFNRRFEKVGNYALNQLKAKKEVFGDLFDFLDGHQRIFVYGAGEYAFKMFSFLRHNHIYIESIIVSDVDDNRGLEDVFDKKLTSLKDLSVKEGDGFICAVSEALKSEIKDSLLGIRVKESDIMEVDERIIVMALK